MTTARMLITLGVLLMFTWLIYLIFFEDVAGTTRDLLFILVGGFLSSFQNIIDYWFKVKDKKECKE
jgi:hypothetical protein|tara:strand:- start:701 stop:898 length:198 start_codon:yes stop_codon:yes gene_type:complete